MPKSNLSKVIAKNRADKRRKVYLSVIEDKERKKDPIAYRLNSPRGLIPWQRKFVNNKKMLRMVNGTNRSGKTEVGVTEVTAEIAGIHPHQLSGLRRMPPHKDPTQSPLIWRICCSELVNGIKKTLLPKLRKLIKPSLLLYPADFDKSYNKLDKTLYFKDGSEIQLMTYTQTVDKFESVAVDGVVFDEPPPEDIFSACLVRMLETKKMKMIITATLNIDNESWANSLIDLARDSAEVRRHFYYVKVKTADNPYIHKENIKIAGLFLSDHQKAVRLGEGSLKTHWRYPNFEPRYPWIIKHTRIPKTWTRHLGYDYHSHKASPMVFIAVNEHGRMFAYHEAETPKYATYKEIADNAEREKNFDCVNGETNDFYLQRGDPVTLRVSGTEQNRGRTKLDLIRGEGWVGLDLPANRNDKQNQATILNSYFKLRRWCMDCGKMFPIRTYTKCVCGSKTYEDAPQLQIMRDKKTGQGCPNLINELPRVHIVITKGKRLAQKETFEDEKQDYAQALRHIIGDRPYYFLQETNITHIHRNTNYDRKEVDTVRFY